MLLLSIPNNYYSVDKLLGYVYAHTMRIILKQVSPLPIWGGLGRGSKSYLSIINYQLSIIFHNFATEKKNDYEKNDPHHHTPVHYPTGTR